MTRAFEYACVLLAALLYTVPAYANITRPSPSAEVVTYNLGGPATGAEASDAGASGMATLGSVGAAAHVKKTPPMAGMLWLVLLGFLSTGLFVTSLALAARQPGLTALAAAASEGAHERPVLTAVPKMAAAS